MKTARIFRHDGLIYVCDDAAPGLSTKGGGHVSKAAALRAARSLGFTHCVGSGTYGGNQLQELGKGFSFRKFAADRRRQIDAKATHTQLDLDGVGE